MFSREIKSGITHLFVKESAEQMASPETRPVFYSTRCQLHRLLRAETREHPLNLCGGQRNLNSKRKGRKSKSGKSAVNMQKVLKKILANIMQYFKRMEKKNHPKVYLFQECKCGLFRNQPI